MMKRTDTKNMRIIPQKTNQDAQQQEDSLEYFIKFPNQNYTEELNTDYVLVHKENNVPIILLLGWAGCKDRYLMKYSKIYEDRGLITIRYTAPINTLFWNRRGMIPIGEKILQLICDMNFESHPIIIHIFSNGGAYIYQHIMLAANRYNIPLEIRGMIFDSAPGERRIMGLYRAVLAIYNGNEFQSSITALLLTVTLSMIWFFEEIYLAFKSMFVEIEPLQRSPFTDLKNEPSHCPQLFLYSKRDDVIPYQDIEKFIKLRQLRGVDVSYTCFEDAEHVKIFTKYPSDYITNVFNFIKHCLSFGDIFSNTNLSTPTKITEKLIAQP